MKRLLILMAAFAMVVAPAGAQKKDTYHVRTVVIDPGHGGAKPGAQGSRTQEKTITLAIAKKFGKLLEDNYPDLKVIYTRTTDVDISLAERAHIANRNKADLFISIHANSHPTSTPTGVETFVMGLSESRANLEVAKAENADILLEADYKSNEAYKGFDPNAPESFVMLAMFQNAYLDKSLNLAQAIQSQYKQRLKTINRGVKQAELFVLYKTTCPSVLTEVGFISNPTEEAFMMSDEGQAQIAVCLFNAFMHFKATEEGSARPANPVIDLPGYRQPQKEAPKATPAVAVADEPAVEAPAAEPRQEAPAAEPKPVTPAEPVAPAAQESAPQAAPASDPGPKAEPEASGVEAVATPATDRPVPGAALAPQQPVQTPTTTPEPAPAAPKAAGKEPVREAPKPAPVLKRPSNTADPKEDYYFTVQFLTSAERLQQGCPEFGGIQDVDVYRNGRFYCYAVGRFATFKEASDYSREVKAATPFKDAWALRRTKESAAAATAPVAAPSPAQAHSDGTTYRVQFCTATREMKAGDPDLGGIKDFRYSKSGNYYVYTAGNYATRAEAERRCAELRRTTSFKDAFVVAFRGGERVSH